MMWRRASRRRAERTRGAPAPPGCLPRRRTTDEVGASGSSAAVRLVARIGAPSLIALASALALLALAVCALFVPGFVLPANADTTGSTQAAPADTAPSSPATTDPTPVQPAPADPSSGRRLVTLPWGSADGQVGLVTPVEGLTRGPEALAVSPNGRIAILDSVNARLVVLEPDGSFDHAFPVTLTEPRFLAVNDTTIYVLDADADHQLVSMDWQGTPLHSAQMPALEDVVTGVFATDDGPCVEVAHDSVFLVEFKDTGAPPAQSQTARTGKPATAALHATTGRPIDRNLDETAKITFKPKDGLKLKRYKVDKKSLNPAQTQTAAPKFAPGRTVEQVVSMDGDGQGGLIIGARLSDAKGDPKDAPSLIIGRLASGADQNDAAPVLTDTLTLHDAPFVYLGQPYVVAPDGRIFQPVGSEQGYTIMVYSLPSTEEAQP